MLCDDLEEASKMGGEGRHSREGIYIYIYLMADSFSCTAETNTIL